MEIPNEYNIKVPEKVDVKGGDNLRVLEFKNCRSLEDIKTYVAICKMMNMVDILRPAGENILV